MFNTFKKILTSQTIQPSDADKVSQFILLRWISGDARLLPLANAINTCGPLTVDNLTLCQSIQSFLNGKVSFIKYPSSKKKDQQAEKECELIARYFEVGLGEAKEYYDWCKLKCPKELDTLRKIYKVQG